MKTFFLTSLYALFFLIHSLPAAAQDTITWIYSDFPPVHITSGPLKGQGYGDYITTLLINNMPEFHHERLSCNPLRAKELMLQKSKVANPALLKRPDREKFIEFSIPAYVVIPNTALIFKRHLEKLTPYLNKEGQLQLARAITESNLKLGINVERAYGGIIDETLAKYKTHRNIHTNFTMLGSQLALMEKERIDYAIGYPMEAQYLNKKYKNRDAIVCIPIEGMPDYYLGYVGCPKNEWGKNVIGKINEVLLKYRNTPEYKEGYESWLDENSIKRLREYIKEAY
ncbi:TIGR02285 family protein [Salidesulfovibrio onnuriiensis]|uniref:TIGR02285 family protein n=1 Tax=Salidesulfovibrio onnuriiensis TaxID=2583823 RepID=UPI0011CB2BF6|nr:TIGR02285 family protein [Salidesulfovibrio onnuriiensis]